MNNNYSSNFTVGQIEGGWREWSPWNTCSVTCGHGLQRRWRLCDSPIPKNGGNSCKGEFVQRQMCFTSHCIETSTVAINTSNSNCLCGCLLSNEKGRFFARTCGNMTDWILKPSGRFLYLKLTYSSLVINKLRMKIYRGWKKEELVYDSETQKVVPNDSLFFANEDYFVISLMDINNSYSSTDSGLEISFEWQNITDMALPGITSGFLDDHALHPRNLHSMWWFLSIAFFCIVITLLPPFLCAHLTILIVQKKDTRRTRQQYVHKLLGESRFDINMIRSQETDITEIPSNPNVVTKRSIGIQLSACSTPRYPRYRGIFWSSRSTHSPQITPRNDGHSSSSFNTENDLEYDYYEPAVPGSFLTSNFNFYSEIDIDQIIGGDSELSRSLISRNDACTQIDIDT
ncbi:unnamed protein product [Thelazia callipaeda]|uniref:THSD1 n=1 Tax=Thelazia callipaeda TaxID=103827 RepID=A0A0N5CU11_THECL|nr:unnamed protein product [Thelazia callipaeda]